MPQSMQSHSQLQSQLQSSQLQFQQNDPPINPEAMRSHANEVVNTLKLLGNADRLLLLCQLAEQERTVSDLERLTDIRQPSLSQQLAILRRDGVVSTRREGKFIWYRLANERMLLLMNHLQELFCPQPEAA